MGAHVGWDQEERFIMGCGTMEGRKDGSERLRESAHIGSSRTAVNDLRFGAEVVYHDDHLTRKLWAIVDL